VETGVTTIAKRPKLRAADGHRKVRMSTLDHEDLGCASRVGWVESVQTWQRCSRWLDAHESMISDP
jgi:hypothetical protein